MLFIVIVGIAAGAMMSVFGGNQGSAETLVERQARAVAEALLNEVRDARFTYCDPQATNFGTANAFAACNPASMAEVVPGGPEAGESRTGLAKLDNVSDYNNLALAPIASLNAVPALGLAGYSATVSVTAMGAPGTLWNAVPANEVAVITVTVTTPALRSPVAVTGLRTLHAPHGEAH